MPSETTMSHQTGLPQPNPPPDSPTARDAALMRLAQGGDFHAFEELVERYRDRVYRIARRILGQDQDAEDATQQTFLSIIEHIDSFRWESAVGTWILRIATNQSLKVLRKRKGSPSVSFTAEMETADRATDFPHPDYIAEWQANPVELAQRAEVRKIMDAAVEELNEKLRPVFILRESKGCRFRRRPRCWESQKRM